MLKCLYNCDDQSLLDNNSLIQRLDPFLQNGILGVGGRLRCADLPHKTKHPAIGKVMSLRYSFVTLINGCHAGRGHVISNLRERYWITKVNTAVRHVISKCVFCRRSYPRPSAQKMADLPKNRISPAPPFTYTDVDYFGPFIIKEARKEVKGYHKEKSRWINKEYGHCLSEESFRTLICEVEAIINSRPLTTVSDKPTNLSHLPPTTS